MNYSDIVDNFSVLLLEGDPVHRELLDKWITGVSTKLTAEPRDVFFEFDASVAVVLLSQSSLGEDEAKIRKFVLNRNPYCQLVLLASSPIEDVLYGGHYDATLSPPISRPDLQRVIAERLKYGIYRALLGEFYYLNAALLAVHRSNDPTRVDDRAEIEERIRGVRAPLALLESVIDDEDVDQLRDSVSLHRRYLKQPSERAGTSTGSKYHPDECPNCSLAWGVHHGNDLGLGLSRMGASVWKCTRCDHIVDNPNASNRYVT